MIKIAITGGICSGKTTVCKYLESLNFKVFYADDVAKHLAENSYELIYEITKEFGENSYISAKYNSKYIANIVFNDKDKLNTLNKIFEPFIQKEFDIFVENNSDQNTIFYESALIFEHLKENEFDYLVTIFAPEKIVIDRLIQRNGLSEKEIQMRLNNQINPLIKCANSNFLINTVSKPIPEQIFKMLYKICNIYNIEI